MSQKTAVNGDQVHSVTLDHIVSYPLVADSLHFYQQNPLGAKSIHLAQSAYETFAVPVLPLFKTPYSYVSPYLAKADSFGDDALKRVDEQFPGLKKTDFSTVKSHASAAASYPFKVAGEGRDYVWTTYDEEYKQKAKSGQNGLVTTSRAVISTEVRIAAETMRAVADWLGPKKEEAEAHLEKAKQIANEKAHKTKKAVNDAHANHAHHNHTN